MHKNFLYKANYEKLYFFMILRDRSVTSKRRRFKLRLRFDQINKKTNMDSSRPRMHCYLPFLTHKTYFSYDIQFMHPVTEVNDSARCWLGPTYFLLICRSNTRTFPELQIGMSVNHSLLSLGDELYRIIHKPRLCRDDKMDPSL